MRHFKINLDQKNEYVLGYLYSKTHGATNKTEIDKMKKILSRALLLELTDVQRHCLTEFYLKGRKQNQIARELGVCGSTVCRHIKAAEKRLRQIASYYDI